MCVPIVNVLDDGKVLSNKQMIKVPTGTIPDIAELKNAINQKWSIDSGSDDSKIPRMYVQDVENPNAPTETISRKENDVKQKSEGVKGETNGTELHLRESGERTYGTDTGRQVRELAEETRGYKGRETAGNRPGTFKKTDFTTPKAKVTTQGLGIKQGVKNDGVYRVVAGKTKEAQREIKEIHRIASKQGVEAVLFAGGDLHTVKDGKIITSNGLYDPETRKIYVRVDDPNFSGVQLATHEATHDKIEQGEIDINEVRDRVEGAVGPDKVENVAKAYLRAYDDDMTEDDIWKEIICDSAANMNIFDNTLSIIAPQMDTVIETTQKTVEETKQSPRAPPVESGEVKFSRQVNLDEITTEDVKAIQEIAADHPGERISVNQFTSEEIKKAEPFARKLWKEMGVKSPFFRAWFGDWRANDHKTPVTTVPVSTIALEDVKFDQIDYHNDDTDWMIHAGDTVNGETNHYARGSKVSVRLLSDIKRILENAVLLDTEASVKDSPKKNINTVFMHKLYCPVTYNGNTYIAKISVEEYLLGKELKRKAYHLQGIKIEAADGGSSANKTAYTPRSMPASIKNVSDLFQLVKAFDKSFKPNPSSVIVNEDGTPKVVYHGTEEDFTVFDMSKGRANMDIQGSFFSPWEIDAGGYGRNVGVFYLNIKNPAPEGVAYRALRRFQKENNAGQKAREYLKGMGYDGVNNSDEEYIAFYPTQIKSATDNIGTFDGNNPDIRYSRRATGFQDLAEQNRILNEQLDDYIQTKKKLERSQKRVSYLEGQFKRTKEKSFREGEVKNLANDLVKEYSSTAEKSEISEKITDLGKYFINEGYGEVKDINEFKAGIKFLIYSTRKPIHNIAS